MLYIVVTNYLSGPGKLSKIINYFDYIDTSHS